MANLIIKPATGVGNKLIVQDNAGNALITTGDNLAGMSFNIGGQLQLKQWRKLSTFGNNATGDSVLAAPFDGSATITCASSENWVRARYGSTIDHGITWRSGYSRMRWSSDGGTSWIGTCGGSMHAWQDGSHTFGNMITLDHIFKVNSTNAIKVQIVWNGHVSGPGNRHGQYFNEANSDGANYTPRDQNNIINVGHWLILEELAGHICSNEDTA